MSEKWKIGKKLVLRGARSEITGAPEKNHRCVHLKGLAEKTYRCEPWL